tara:strand:- start:1188 stop:2351 length:1164 start_codon:yes stop_codon:yes gene_type:complete
MSYTTLNTLNTSFSDAVSTTAGLDSFLMIDISELNGHHNVNYPLCIIEPPNSSVSNINKSWEEYEFSCFVLQVDDSSISNVAQYDTCLALHQNFLASLMKQRDGDYVLVKDSITIERVRNIGNDNLIGVKVEFNMLIPSVLINDSTPLSLHSDNLVGHWGADEGVDESSAAAFWTNKSGHDTLHLSPYLSTAFAPYYDPIDKEFIFKEDSPTDADNLRLVAYEWNTRDYSFFFKIKAGSNSSGTNNTLFKWRLDSESDYSVGYFIPSGSSNAQALEIRGVWTGGGSSADTTQHSTTVNLPIGSYQVIGIINDAGKDETRIVSSSGVEVLSNVWKDDSITNSDLHIGSYGAAGDATEGFEGSLKDVVLYRDALSDEEAISVVTYLNSL